MIPKLSKYPPRPPVPNGSLKVNCTDEMLSRFQMDEKPRLENRIWNMFCKRVGEAGKAQRDVSI